MSETVPIARHVAIVTEFANQRNEALNLVCLLRADLIEARETISLLQKQIEKPKE